MHLACKFTAMHSPPFQQPPSHATVKHRHSKVNYPLIFLFFFHSTCHCISAFVPSPNLSHSPLLFSFLLCFSKCEICTLKQFILSEVQITTSESLLQKHSKYLFHNISHQVLEDICTFQDGDIHPRFYTLAHSQLKSTITFLH